MNTFLVRRWNPWRRFRARLPASDVSAAPPAGTPGSDPTGRVTPSGDAGFHAAPRPQPSGSTPPERAIRVTVLVENAVHGRELRAEHGLAFCIHTEHGPILFDTGQSDLIVHNAALLGILLGEVQAVALSHGHYDHVGGLSSVRAAAPHVQVFLHPDAIQPKFSRPPGGAARPVGMPTRLARELDGPGDHVTWTSKPTELVDGVFVTGPIPRTTGFEDTGGPFFLDEAGQRPDPLRDDQAAFFDSADGIVVLLGCAHAGVVNTLRYIRQLTDQRPIHAVLGGFHLLSAAEDRIRRTLETLEELNVRTLGAAHCTGQMAVARLWTTFPERCCTCAVGSQWVFRR